MVCIVRYTGCDMSFLGNLPREALEDFVRRSHMPMICSMPDGKILYANEAFCEEMGYSEYELVGPSGKSWLEFSLPDDDLEHDRRSAEASMQAKDGSYSSYTIKKHYIPKNEKPVPVVLKVLRYPAYGEFEFFIVCVFFIQDASRVAHDAAMERLDRLEATVMKSTDAVANLVVELSEVIIESRSDDEHLGVQLAKSVAKFWVAYPRTCFAILFVVITMIFGTSVSRDVLSAGLKAFGVQASQPENME